MDYVMKYSLTSVLVKNIHAQWYHVVPDETNTWCSLFCHDRMRYLELLRVNEQRNILHEIKKRKANWIGHILRRNCLLKQVIEGKVKEEMEVTRRRGRRRKKLLDDLKDRRGYSHLKEEALDHTMRRNRFGGGFEPVVRQNTEWWWWLYFQTYYHYTFVWSINIVTLNVKWITIKDWMIFCMMHYMDIYCSLVALLS